MPFGVKIFKKYLAPEMLKAGRFSWQSTVIQHCRYCWCCWCCYVLTAVKKAVPMVLVRMIARLGMAPQSQEYSYLPVHCTCTLLTVLCHWQVQ